MAVPAAYGGQEFFQRERDKLAPNLKVLLKAELVELENAVLFPCPLLRRHEANDPTAWLRSTLDFGERFDSKPRIILAHGSVLNFGTLPDDDESDASAPNLIDLARLSGKEFDYIALGDWHGAKQVTEKAWYSGTPELDRFVKGQDHNPGNILNRMTASTLITPTPTVAIKNTVTADTSDRPSTVQPDKSRCPHNHPIIVRPFRRIVRFAKPATTITTTTTSSSTSSGNHGGDGNQLGSDGSTGLETALNRWLASSNRVQDSLGELISPLESPAKTRHKYP